MDYLLTIRVPIQAMDDPAAREIALKCVPQYWPDGLKTTPKLQRLTEGKPPVGVALIESNTDRATGQAILEAAVKMEEGPVRKENA